MNLLFGFSGRIGRLKWWLAQLAGGGVLLLGAVLVVISVGTAKLEPAELPPSVFVIIAATFILAVWINLACTVKRFHDRGKSGFWVLIVLVPYIGGIWQIVECGFLSGSLSSNDYGPPPGSRSLSDIEDEVRAAYAEPMNRPASAMQASPAVTMQRPPAPTRRSVPTTGFGRRGAG